MLTIAQLRVPLKAVAILTALALLLSTAATVYAGIRKHNGFMSDNTAITCSSGTYYQTKYTTDHYLKAFAIALVVGVLGCIGGFVVGMVMVCKMGAVSGKEEEGIDSVSEGKLRAVYVFGSVGMLGEMVVVGYCLSLFFDVRHSFCSNNYNPDWMIIGSLSLATLILLFVCMVFTLRLVNLWKDQDDL